MFFCRSLYRLKLRLKDAVVTANSDTKSRKICLATIKKIIQRDDRYGVYTNIPACSDLESLLYNHLHPAWMQEGRKQSQYLFSQRIKKKADQVSFGHYCNKSILPTL